MTDYPFDAIVAIDRVTGDRVVNGSGQVYALDDVARANPLPVFDLTMLPLVDNKLTTNSEAYIPNFKVQDHWRVVFVSGTNEVIVTSHEGLKEAADAAADRAELSRLASEAAASTAGVDAAEAAELELETRIAAGEFKGDPGPMGTIEVGTVTAVGNPTQDAAFAELLADTSSLSRAELEAVVDAAVAESAPEIDLPTLDARYYQKAEVDAALASVAVSYANLPAGSVIYRFHNGTAWPARLTTRGDIVAIWVGPSGSDPSEFLAPRVVNGQTFKDIRGIEA